MHPAAAHETLGSRLLERMVGGAHMTLDGGQAAVPNSRLGEGSSAFHYSLTCDNCFVCTRANGTVVSTYLGSFSLPECFLFWSSIAEPDS